jgi:hypothetical protein
MDMDMDICVMQRGLRYCCIFIEGSGNLISYIYILIREGKKIGRIPTFWGSGFI